MDANLGIIIAITGTGVAVVGAVLSMMFWCRSEANGLRAEAKEDRKDFLQAFRGLEMAINEMKMENKEFHHRLLEIERSRSKSQS